METKQLIESTRTDTKKGIRDSGGCHGVIEAGTNEKRDCGMCSLISVNELMMRHMETFMRTGSDVWDCGLSIDGRKLKQQILGLRKKYATKILLSPINMHEKEIRAAFGLLLKKKKVLGKQ
ncbi:hypothetical protein QVD17_24554 [Tagetes erecta]|uniref:Uncharacterized protein n=1 Tax=Tagetes erecta TaxID=13708 RepID=A0AAD8KF74_TARER|nr:hypothetical protein QVD17_24554 [Tagetes erecta]